MAEDWTAEDMYALGSKHAEIETAGDIDGTMATLVEDPVYDFLPIGKRMRGRDQVRRYYEHLIHEFFPTRGDASLVEEWVSKQSLAQEYDMQYTGPDGPERHRVIGILFVDGKGPLMKGERIWGSERCLRAMVGPLFDELEDIEGT